MENLMKQVEALIEDGAHAEGADAALKFTQAALNTAHALNVLRQIKQDIKDYGE